MYSTKPFPDVAGSGPYRTQWFIICLLLLLFSLPGCKKNSGEPEEEGPLTGTCQPMPASGRLSFADSAMAA